MVWFWIWLQTALAIFFFFLKNCPCHYVPTTTYLMLICRCLLHHFNFNILKFIIILISAMTYWGFSFTNSSLLITSWEMQDFFRNGRLFEVFSIPIQVPSLILITFYVSFWQITVNANYILYIYIYILDARRFLGHSFSTWPPQTS